MNAVYALDLKAYQPDTTYVPKKHKVTEAEYWDKYYDYPDVTYEWNNGELEEKGVSDFVTISMAGHWGRSMGTLQIYTTIETNWILNSSNQDKPFSRQPRTTAGTCFRVK